MITCDIIFVFTCFVSLNHYVGLPDFLVSSSDSKNINVIGSKARLRILEL